MHTATTVQAPHCKQPAPKKPVPLRKYGEQVVPPKPNDVFNTRQIEVLKLIAQGLCIKEIGAKLFMSPSTANLHKLEVIRRLSHALGTKVDECVLTHYALATYLIENKFIRS